MVNKKKKNSDNKKQLLLSFKIIIIYTFVNIKYVNCYLNTAILL